MPDKIGFFDDAFEQGKQVVKQTATQVAGLPGQVAKTAVSQVVPGATPPVQAPSEGGENSPDNKKKQAKPLSPAPKNNSQILKGQFIKPSPQKLAQEQADIAKVRQELHQSYYQDLTNKPKPNEERVADKIEREEKEEEQKKFVLAQKKKKEDAGLVNIKQGTGEKVTGIGG